MNKVYVIEYKETYSNGDFSAGTSYVYSNLPDARNMLKTIMHDEMAYYMDNGWDEDDIKQAVSERTDEFIINFGDEYETYIIREMEVK